METKKHDLSRKKVQGAVATFIAATSEIEKANELLDASIAIENKRIKELETLIQNYAEEIDYTEAAILSKQAEKNRNENLVTKFKEFTI